MYLHLGSGVAIPYKNIIGIFDLDNTSTSKITQNYLRAAQDNGEVETVSYELPRSFIVCEEYGKPKIYISPISSQTLMKRTAELDLT
jgi:hypothetical protein